MALCCSCWSSDDTFVTIIAKKQAVEVLLYPFSLGEDRLVTGDEGSSADRLAFHTCFPHISSVQHKKRERPRHRQHGLGVVNDYNYFNGGEM